MVELKTFAENILKKLEKTYYVKGKCSNCKKTQFIKIPKGKKVDEYIIKASCKHCGCMTMKK